MLWIGFDSEKLVNNFDEKQTLETRKIQPLLFYGKNYTTSKAINIYTPLSVFASCVSWFLIKNLSPTHTHSEYLCWQTNARKCVWFRVGSGSLIRIEETPLNRFYICSDTLIDQPVQDVVYDVILTSHDVVATSKWCHVPAEWLSISPDVDRWLF